MEPEHTAAIFSPSVARVAASTARDWSYVNSWLKSKFLDQRRIPPFEQNAETLKAFLDLAAHNEAADEARRLLERAEAESLQRLRQRQFDTSQSRRLRDDLLQAIVETMPEEGEAALMAMARTAVKAGIAYPEQEQLARHMVDLQASLYDLEQMTSQTDILHRQVQQEIAEMQGFLDQLQTDDYKVRPHLAKRNLDTQRELATASAVFRDLQQHHDVGTSLPDALHPSVKDVQGAEEEYMGILSRKKLLDNQMSAFGGLPANVDMARAEIDALRHQLQDVTSHRDAVFEGLVERESPAKPRRRCQ